MIKKNFYNPLTIQAEAQCGICGNIIKDSYYSKCKHSFCKTCINNYLSRNNRCPVCSTLLKVDEVYPNILANHVKNMYFINSYNGEIIEEDMHTKFKKKFEYADFLIELTIIKNFLLKIYDKKLKELEEFRRKLIYLKKDIIFLETILNNSEDDLFCFLEKLMKSTNIDNNTLNKNPTISEDIKKEKSNNDKMEYEEANSQKRTNRNDNLEDNNKEPLQDNANNKRIKLDHLKESIDFHNNCIDFNLEDQINDNKYINYNNVRNIITKVLNENIKGESFLKSLIFNSYKENILNSINNDALNRKNHHQNTNSENNTQINPLINPVLSTTNSFAIDTCNCAQGEFGAPAYLDVNFCYVDSADDKNGSSTSNKRVAQENNNIEIGKVDMTDNDQDISKATSIDTKNLKLKDPEESNETTNKNALESNIKNINQGSTSSKLKMKNVDYGSEEEGDMNIIDNINSNKNNNDNNYSYNTQNLNKIDNYSSKDELRNNNDINNNDEKAKIKILTEKEKQLLEEESRITKKILKDINKEQKQLKSSLSKKMKNLMNRERQIEKNKKEIEKCYFSNQRGFCPDYCIKDQCLNLSRFTNYFRKFSQYTQFRTIASINYADNFLNNSSCIVSAVEFDKNDDFFASAGVLKKIRIYDFNNVIYNYRELYKNEGKNEIENIIYQDDEHKQYERKNKIALEESNSFYFPSSSSPPTNINNDHDINKHNTDVSTSSLLPYMSTLPNKIPLTSILLNPDIEVGADNSSYNSNHSFSSHDTSSESADNSYMSTSNLDYITRYPIQEMTCNSKISCLSYSYEKQRNLLSSDYEGIITLWDAETGTAVSNFNEHEKRAWCVDYNVKNPTLFASGSDDSTVKIWDENVPYSTLTIDSRANICSVAFNPYNEYEIAFGSADHNIYYYDIRNAKKAWGCIRGHKKAISYVKFRNRYEFVSASTDNTLKLWSINPYVLDMNNNENINHKVQLIRTYSGHTNERNFAGLSINKDGDFILCGSETNEIYIYYSEFERPIIVQNFGNIEDNVTGSERDYFDTNQFISSLSWKKTSENMLIAANSEGRVKVFELV